MCRPENYINIFEGDTKLSSGILIFMLIFANATATFSKTNDYAYAANNDSEDDPATKWEQWQDGKENLFYINHDTKTAQKQDPNESITKVSRRGTVKTIAWSLRHSYIDKLPYPDTIDDKITLFYQQIDKLANNKEMKNEAFIIDISRSNVLRDSYHIVMQQGAERYLRRMLKVRLDDEVNADTEEHFAREWLSLLSNEISDPRNGFFQYVDEKNYESEINPDFKDLSYFKFIGRVVATAIYHKIVVNVYFVEPYYKTMIAKPIKLEDVKTADPIYYNGLLQAEEEDLKDHVPQDMDTKNKSKTELIRMIIYNKYVTRVQNQMSAFLEGFNDLIPLNLLRIFTADELKLVIGGVQSIDVDDWQQNTNYFGYDAESKVVIWFWNIVRRFDNDKRKRLLQFVTGTFRVPANGFKNLSPRFTISDDYRTIVNQSPRASLCANTITISDYSSEEEMQMKIENVIEIEHRMELC